MNSILIASLLSTPLVLPQETAAAGEVRAMVTSEKVRVARAGDEGVARFPDRSNEDVSRYQPLEVLENESMHIGPTEAISYDVKSGVETLHALSSDPFRTQGWLAGSALSNEVDESLDANFGSFTKITSTAFPWSTQARIFFNQGGGSYICSGTMIDAKNVISAGHCVHEGPGGTWSTGLWVAPRWDGDAGAFGSANATLLSTFTGWTSSGSGNHDMAFVRLDRPVGFLTGWLGTFWNSDNGFWYGTTFNLAGFPGVVSSTFPEAPHTMYYAFGTWNVMNTYTADAVYPTTVDFGGLSGSGVYYIDGSGNRYVGGDHRSSFTSGGVKYRRSCRMTQSKFDYFHNTFKRNGYSTTQVDYVPLRARCSSSSIQRGTTTTLRYVVGNSSLYNPASATVDVDVYLSTNSNVSEFDTLIQSHNFTWNFGATSSVTVAASVLIPGTTTAGTYYVGVIVDETDADTSNNDTDGWDAHRVAITN